MKKHRERERELRHRKFHMLCRHVVISSDITVSLKMPLLLQEAPPPHHHSPSHQELEGLQGPERSPLQGQSRTQTGTVREEDHSEKMPVMIL
ncbi:hypothetical protein JZ751_004282 [Albula glossodonta]|uniref:Uncharacterized protein n=1 Tax=Albula glossodonta TaxID=121402 RepID=A0A8T2MU82_9TELE|nr:hypothetical protein JZ751_015543 [Albula glossodonta]KAG9329541.1 hypothetical protein JZ751_004282 [Albula glossodonta]